MQSTDIKKSSKRNILYGTIIGYVSIIVNVASGLFVTPILIQSIGKSEYGIYTLVLSVINLFVMDFGLGAAANAFLSKYRAESDDVKIKNFINTTFTLYLYIDFFVYCILIAVYPFLDSIYAGLTSAELDSFRSVYLIVGIFSLVSLPSLIFNSILTAFEKFGFSKLVSLITKLMYVVGVFIIVVTKGNLFALVLTHVLTELISIILKYLYCKIVFKIRFSLAFLNANDLKEIGAFSLWALINSIVSRLVFTIMPSILGITSNSNQIAIFGIIVTIEQYIYSISTVMGGFFLPSIERIKHGNNLQTELFELNNKVGRFQFFVISLIFVGFVCCGKEFILLWMSGDTDFIHSYYGIILVIIYHLLYVPELVFHSAMQSESRFIKHLAICSSIKAISNLILAIPLTLKFGALGGAISVCVARIIDLVLQNYFYAKDLKIDIFMFAKKVLLPFLFPFSISLIVGLVLHFFLPFSLLFNFLIIGSAVVVLYFVLCIRILPINRFKGKKHVN